MNELEFCYISGYKKKIRREAVVVQLDAVGIEVFEVVKEVVTRVMVAIFIQEVMIKHLKWL
jgi:hypothetical protein